MTQLHNIISELERQKHASDAGTKTHAMLARTKSSTEKNINPTDIVEKIQKQPILVELFSEKSKTEVPIAGFINNRFISRRIDRLLISHSDKIIKILDYKTDLTPEKHKQKYIIQLNEYAALLHAIYPTYKINKYILWTHNFLLENIV